MLIQLKWFNWFQVKLATTVILQKKSQSILIGESRSNHNISFNGLTGEDTSLLKNLK